LEEKIMNKFMENKKSGGKFWKGKIREQKLEKNIK